ncbi:MAG: response regulator [Saprospiraceae bacterium]|nr:response regulator [Saprospiraceae bacterium]
MLEPFDQHHTILIVEDNVELAHYLRSVIAPHFNTEVAINGQDGIEKAMETIPDLIVSDVMMPVKDGYELCDTLKKDYKTNHIPIILLTARADSESKIMGFQKGADDYISKPFHSRELLVRIRKMIEQREKLKLKYSLSPIEMTGAENHFISLDDMFIAEILQHLEKNYADENFGIDELCSAMKISRVQLHRKLIALTGLSASHFINKFRLEKAVKLLKSTRNTVSEIAFDVGFHDSNYFSRVFSKVFGVSPGDFRKQKQ